MDRFRRLAWPQMPVLLRAAGYLTREAHAAEDLVQETMIRAMTHIDSFVPGTNIRAWLMTILRRTHIDRYRSDRRRVGDVSLDAANLLAIELPGVGGDESSEMSWDAPEDLLERFEDQTVILALKTLPEDLRWTLLLVDVEQMDHADAAGVLGVAVGTIKSRASRGRAMLRDRLAQVARRHGLLEAVKEPEG